MKTSFFSKSRRLVLATSVLAACAALPQLAQAVIVAEYNFTGTSLTSSDSSLDSTASDLTTVGFTSVINVSIGDPAPAIFAQADLTDSPGASPNFIPAPSASDYFSFTVTPIATSLDYTTLTMDVRTMTNHAADYYFSIQTSLDSFATNIATYHILGSASTLTFQPYSFDLSAFSASAVAQEFRIVIRDGTSSASRGLVFDNITLNTVPEPTTAALVLGTLGAGMLLRRRRSNPSSSDTLS